MNLIIKQLELIQRIDQLIRMHATGTPVNLASRLGISRAQTYRIIDIMKALNAPIEYDFTIQSFVYAKGVDFKFGFYAKDLSSNNVSEINADKKSKRIHPLLKIS
ncbi:hypothetical protein ABW636_20485 [Aquimarina sp. 2201CG1-2-11]|uniref:hypothetical protein n=1 Tax=Aquimarina discodermiae TaxID=3231043 RepID=UPI003463847C